MVYTANYLKTLFLGIQTLLPGFKFNLSLLYTFQSSSQNQQKKSFTEFEIKKYCKIGQNIFALY